MKDTERNWWVGQIAAIYAGIGVGVKTDSVAIGFAVLYVIACLVDMRRYLSENS